MRIAVIGGTGVAGSQTVAALRREGHDAVIVSRSRGVDVSAGTGLDGALAGVDAVIDVTAVQAADAEATRKLFGTATRNLLAAEQRATQFHEFAGTVVSWMRQGDVATVPPPLLQPVAASDVGDVLAEIVAGAPQGRARDLAGPEPQDFVDMARRTLAARGESIRLIPSWRSGLFGVEAAGEAMLPGPDTRLAPTTFDAWLAAQGAPASAGAREPGVSTRR